VQAEHPVDAVPMEPAKPPGEALQAKAEAAEARLETVLAAISDAFVTLDAEWRYTYANPRASEIVGLPREQLLGKSIWEIFPDVVGDPFYQALHRARDEQAAVQLEYHFTTWQRWFEHRIVPSAGGVSIFTTDVTERKLAEAASDAARVQAEAAGRRASFLADAGALLAASLGYEATLERLGRLAVPRIADYSVLFEIDSPLVRQAAVAHVDPAKEPLLTRLGEIGKLSLDDPGNPVAAVARSGQPALGSSSAAESLRPAGDSAEMDDLCARLGGQSSLILPLAARGQVLGVLLLATAESGRRYGPDDLALGSDLAHRAALAIDNARLYREAQRANIAKDRFLSTLSHELRTPLTPVLAVVSGLELRRELPADVHGGLAMIRRNVELEARLIDDLLDLTRVSRGKLVLELEVADLRQVLKAVFDGCRAQHEDAARRRLVLDLGADEHHVWADTPRLNQVFWNLLQNAIKFTSEDGTVTLASSNEGRWLRVDVADTGVGIDPELLPRIFEPFEQGQRGITHRFGGLGLGLAISRAIVELHGGSLAAASPGPGHGATFSVRLPLGLPLGTIGASSRPATEQATDDAAAGHPENGTGETPTGLGAMANAIVAATGDAPLHILVVEDHPDSATALADLLRSVGHRVTLAENVAAAVARAEAAALGLDDDGGFDLVLSDLGLPDGTGFDLMRRLADRYGLRGIALSGYGAEADIARSRAAGFATHLTKPVHLRALTTAIQGVMRTPARGSRPRPAAGASEPW
jgi:PAS domain S-box-containing protein